MRSHTLKMLLLFGIYSGLHLAEACRNHDPMDCECPDVLPFFDYSKLKISTDTPGGSQPFRMDINADSVHYLAESFRWPALGLMQTAQACDCVWNGHEGPKFLVEKFNIYADRAFNDTLPAGASLNSLFFVNGGDVLISIQPDQAYDYFWAFGEGADNIRPLSVLSFEKPGVLDVPFVFKVEFVKTDGSTLQAFSNPVVFH